MGLENAIKISIVTPVYNGADSIRDLIYSILDQSCSNWELIIQDGQSSDDTVRIVQSFQDHRIKVYSESDNGMYDALNKAINKTSGEYILHLNSDEQLIEDALSKIINQIKVKPDFEVYCFGVIIIDRNRKPRVFRAAYPQKNIFIKLFNLDILTAGIIYKREVFSDLKFNTKYEAVSDALLFMEVVERYEIYYSKNYISFFLIEGKNLSLEERALKERNKIRASVFLSKINYVLLYLPRKLFKLFHNCREYTGPQKMVRLYYKGEKIKRKTTDLTFRLSWESLN